MTEPVNCLAKRARLTGMFSLVLFMGISACATSGPPGSEFDDPYESVNRSIHEFNVELDRRILRPVSFAYGFVLPDPVRTSVTNFSHNADLPGEVLNDALQGDIVDTVHNTFRFMINTSLGVLGLFDPATSIGLERRTTDFGETLHVWGVGEGAYIEQPFFGPSTQRDTVGDVVDFALNPLQLVLTPPESYLPRIAWLGEQAGDRYDFANTIDSILYESADSYAQARLIYLENRRFQLGGAIEDTYFDPYEELYGE